MIISPGRSFIFVHIPKSGGTSMALALEARAMRDDLLLGDTPKARRRRHRWQGMKTRGRLWKHSRLADLEGMPGLPALGETFCFTLVRNPWDRMVSYYHWLREQSFDHSAVALAARLTFRDFVTHSMIATSFKNHPARWYMTDATGVERADVYLRLEHLRDDLVPVEAHLGFALDVPRVNVSPRSPDYRPYYDTVSAEAVAVACAEDIARFGYSFESGGTHVN